MTPFKPAERLNGIEVSTILQISAEARRLRSLGHEVIALSQGEPDFATPAHVVEAGYAAASRGETKYSAVPGSVALREAICDKLAQENDLRYSIEQVIASTGAKQVIHNALFATLNPGDEVIIPTPAWTNYIDIVRLFGATPVLLPTDAANGFRPDVAAIAAAINPHTRWIMLNSPSNPAGAVLDADFYRDLAAAIAPHPQVWLMNDEIYEHIIYDGPHVSAAAAAPELADRTLTVNGVSKAHAMTGWRLGYGAGPQPLIAAMTTIQSQNTSGPSTISQAAAIAALTGPDDHLSERLTAFRARRDLVVAKLNDIDGLTCLTPPGAFYVYPSCAALIGATTPTGTVIDSDDALAWWLLKETNVAVVPGSGFAHSPNIRLSYATGTEHLTEAMNRIAAAIASLTPVGG